MSEPGVISAVTIERYLRSRPKWIRWRERLAGRRYRVARFSDRERPLLVVAFQARDHSRVEVLERALAEDWQKVPSACREAYSEILRRAPRLIVIQLRRNNVCGCLGHRHVAVQEKPFAFADDALGVENNGEVDIAYERVKSWQALPLTDTALDTKFLEGSRLAEFHATQFRLRLLSVVLHEVHHLAFQHDPENSVRERSLNFYRVALSHYVESAVQTLAFTIDRSFTPFG
jgi:hypothetical protein